jgi:hypothetical protein
VAAAAAAGSGVWCGEVNDAARENACPPAPALAAACTGPPPPPMVGEMFRAPPLSERLARRFHPQFLDENRRDI